MILLTCLSKKYGEVIPVLGHLSKILLSAAFFVSGYFFRQVERGWMHSVYVFTAGLFVLILATYKYDYPIQILSFKLQDVIPFYIVGIFGIVSTMYISKFLERLKFMRVPLYYIGNHTMIILALHFLSFKSVSFIKIICYSLPINRLAEFPVIEFRNKYFWILYSISGVLLPIMIRLILQVIQNRKIPNCNNT